MLLRLAAIAPRSASGLPRLVRIGAAALSITIVVGLHVALVERAALMLA